MQFGGSYSPRATIPRDSRPFTSPPPPAKQKKKTSHIWPSKLNTFTE